MFDLERFRRWDRQVDHGNDALVEGAIEEIERLRECLSDTRHEICKGPVDDTLWHTGMPSCTTVDNICMALGDDWDYDQWLAEKVNATMEGGK